MTDSAGGQVWDCFYFNNELDLLEFRLTELDPVVDRFVIVEGDRTYDGTERVLEFARNRDRFARFESKIVNIVAKLPEHGMTRPERESVQHAALRPVVESAGPRDLLLIGDVDEIPFCEVVPKLLDNVRAPLRLELSWSLYKANWILPRRFLEGPFACRLEHLSDRGVRSLLGESMGYEANYRELVLPNAGRHISYLGDPQKIRTKFDSSAEYAYDNVRGRTIDHLENLTNYGVHYEGRWLANTLREHELDPMLQRMRAMRPKWFNFRQPSRSKAKAYRGYTWLLRHGVIPDAARKLVSRSPGIVTGYGAPVFLAADLVLELRRKIRPAPEHWKMWRHADYEGNPIGEFHTS